MDRDALTRKFRILCEVIAHEVPNMRATVAPAFDANGSACHLLGILVGTDEEPETFLAFAKVLTDDEAGAFTIPGTRVIRREPVPESFKRGYGLN